LTATRNTSSLRNKQTVHTAFAHRTGDVPMAKRSKGLPLLLGVIAVLVACPFPLPAVHAGDVAGMEIELLAFDCFENAPLYHYGPRNRDVRLYWDTTLVPDALSWTLEQFKGGQLPAMIERAGYSTIAASMDRELVVARLEQEVEPTATALRAANTT
jgi:hypothetical protein